jgi:DNA polymerase-3 subunit beta
MTTVVTTGALSVPPKELADALKAVKPAVGTRSAVEALSGVRITGDGRQVFLHATDMDISCRRALNGAVATEPIDTLVKHADLERAAKALAKAGKVSITVEDGDLAVRGGTRRIGLNALRMEDFPALPGEIDQAGAVPILTGDAATLKTAIDRAYVFASRDETRPILTGLCLDGTSIVATDSYRLAVVELEGVWVLPDTQVLAGARGLKLAAKAMTDGMVTLAVKDRPNASSLLFVSSPRAGELWTIRTIDGKFPDWRQLMPEAWDMEVTVPTSELRSAAELAVQFAKKNAPMRMSINGEVKVSGHTPDVCDFEETLPGATHTGGEMEIGFNPEYMRDIAKAVRGSEVTLKLITPLRPGLIVDGGDQFLLMPIRLNA